LLFTYCHKPESLLNEMVSNFVLCKSTHSNIDL
jgi:hypothetical protein